MRESIDCNDAGGFSSLKGSRVVQVRVLSTAVR